MTVEGTPCTRPAGWGAGNGGTGLCCDHNGHPPVRSGRPLKEPPEDAAVQIQALAAVLTRAQMADYFAISEGTLWKWMQKHPELADAYKQGRARVIRDVAASLLSKVRAGDLTAMIFFLKTQAGWKETQRIESEQNVNIGTSDAAEDFTRRIVRLASSN